MSSNAQGYACDMERQSNKHGSRLDDAMEREVESLVRGAPIEARAEPGRAMEDAADGEPTPEAIIKTSSRSTQNPGRSRTMTSNGAANWPPTCGPRVFPPHAPPSSPSRSRKMRR